MDERRTERTYPYCNTNPSPPPPNSSHRNTSPSQRTDDSASPVSQIAFVHPGTGPRVSSDS